jgi:hypothetical protein
MGFRMDPGLTQLVTLDAGAGGLIDGQRTRPMWANEVANLKVNGSGTGWTKVSGKSIPMSSKLGFSTNQTFLANVNTKLTFTVSLQSSGPVGFQDAPNAKVNILRQGRYRVDFTARFTNTNTFANNIFVYTWVNGAQGPSSTQVVGATTNQAIGITAGLELASGSTIEPYGGYSAGSYVTTVLFNDAAFPGFYNALTVTEVPSW